MIDKYTKLYIISFKMEKFPTAQMPEEPLTKEVIRKILGPEMKGVAGVLEILREDERIETIAQLTASIRSHINEFGSLQFTTTNGRQESLLNIERTLPGPLTIIVVDEVVEAILAKLNAYIEETRARIFEVLEQPNEKKRDENAHQRKTA